MPYAKDAFINSYTLAVNLHQEAHIVGWPIMLGLGITKTFQNPKPNWLNNLNMSFFNRAGNWFAKKIRHFDNLLVGSSSIPKCITKFIPHIFLIPKQHWYIPYPYLPVPSFKKRKLMLDNLIDLDGYQGGS